MWLLETLMALFDMPPKKQVCKEDDCQAVVFEMGDVVCHDHERDEWGVMNIDCNCFVSVGDPLDVNICDLHMTIWSKAVAWMRGTP